MAQIYGEAVGVPDTAHRTGDAVEAPETALEDDEVAGIAPEQQGRVGAANIEVNMQVERVEQNKTVPSLEEMSSYLEGSNAGDGFTQARLKKQEKKRKQRERKQLAITNKKVDVVDTPANNLRSKGSAKDNQ